jgi:hypothetical protein
MTHFDTTIDIQAPPDRFWAILFAIEHWFEWTPTVISIRQLDAGPLAVGIRAIVREPKLLPARRQVMEFEEGCSFVIACHSIEDAANGSRATPALDFSGPLGPLCACLTSCLNTRYLAIEARGLKKRAEAEARSQASKVGCAGGSR